MEVYFPNWAEKVFIINKLKNTVTWTYLIRYLDGENIIGTFNIKELQKAYPKEFRIEIVIKREGNKLYVEWKGYDNLFNSWIDEKDIVIWKRSYFLETHTNKNKTDFELDFFNYATKSGFRIYDLANLKLELDKLYIDELKNVPSKLNSCKSKVDKLDVNKLETTPVDLKKKRCGR